MICLDVLLAVFDSFALFILRQATPGILLPWNSLKDDAREGAYESVCLRLKNAEQEIVWLKGAVAVQRTRRERAEALTEDLASWVVKLSDLLRGEFCFLLDCLARVVSMLLS